MGERFPPAVKAATLSTLAALIDRARKKLAAFVSQLQTTFAKALSDANHKVRSAALFGLRRLAVLPNLRPAPLLAQLTT